MIKVNNISFSYPNKKVFEDYSISFEDSRITVIMGNSGCGKTTLLRLIAGLDSPNKGNIVCKGEIVYMFQEQRLLPWCTAIENVKVVLSSKNAQDIAREYLLKFGFTENPEKRPYELSGGQRQRVSLARTFAYARDKDIILIDEPTNGLDKNSKSEIAEIIKKEVAGKMLIVVTHDPDEANALSDIIYNIN